MSDQECQHTGGRLFVNEIKGYTYVLINGVISIGDVHDYGPFVITFSCDNCSLVWNSDDHKGKVLPEWLQRYADQAAGIWRCRKL